ncbi:MAG: HAMP domain-containing sensor histidine kinase [Sodaliphilus pleomorphus]|uniref:sensor histidine kinase n=1 Tax=Sodaliphilus pleomorphus TaxID=2606626 RepID=UPI0023EF9831|nr:HAMP domain-containing sensor histidine kinase [Sodaliphilus pleomorphus]MCI5980294.1 HAMP domain-containing histidine kinase [Muribaculaceae bacterium]MDD7065586.1 HAMP domain-containing sensor histidine kinase [Sodaliphilus pleomorphus]MDY2832386.1 HAMP domain-containing sensor histidine kinase [Sodaliphilus pleomorphus]
MIKPSRKLSLIYSGISILMMTVVGVVVYIVTSGSIQDIYYDYLDDKAELLAIEHFEKNTIDTTSYANVVRRLQNTIPTSKELFINLTDTSKANVLLHRYLDSKEIASLYNPDIETVHFQYGKEVGSALLYQDQTAAYGVLVMSANPYGARVQKVVRVWIVMLTVASLLLLVLVNRLGVVKVMKRIDMRYQREKMFVNNASHEINNPLTAIQGECEIALMKERPREELVLAINKIAAENERVIDVMRSLLQFTSQDTVDRDSLDRIDIEQFMRENFGCPGINITCESNFAVMIPYGLLKIAMRNIVSNAKKYSSHKPVEIKIGHNTVHVVDHGMGIDRSELKHIFEPFYRGARTRGIEGHGIGLSLAKQILDTYGARISIKSKPGQGSTFTVHFA